MANKVSRGFEKVVSSESEREVLSWIQLLFSLMIVLPVVVFFAKVNQLLPNLTISILLFLALILLKFVLETTSGTKLFWIHRILVVAYPLLLSYMVFEGKVLEIVLYLAYLLVIVDGLFYYGIGGAILTAVWQGMCYSFLAYGASPLAYPYRYFALLVLIYYLVAVTTLFCLRELALRSQRNAEKDRLIAETINQMKVSINHELGNPLAGIFGNLKVLREKEKDLDDIGRQAIESISHESEKMKVIMEDLDNLTAPIIEEYLPGIKMINIRKSTKKPVQ